MSDAINTSLNTLNNTSKILSFTSSDISSSQTSGYKQVNLVSQANFSQSSPLDPGSGSFVAAVKQDFSQGAIEHNDDPLNMAISGNGFFVNSANADGKGLLYTRDGNYKVNKNNQIVNYSGNYLMGYKLDDNNEAVSLSAFDLEPIVVDSKIGKPTMTENIDISVNLPVLQNASDAKPLHDFDPDNPSTYNFATSSTVFDSLGSGYTLKSYYLKPGLRASLINTQTGIVDSRGEVVIDCSQVYSSAQFDPTQADTYPETPADTYKLKNHAAWAVFYTINGKPLQPLAADLEDTQGFQYQAYNADYRNEDKLYENVKAKSSTSDDALRYININNQFLKTAKAYPSARDLKDNPYGDKSPKRPYDFWRCEFIFSNQKGEIISPFAENNGTQMQYLGRTDRVAGSATKTPEPDFIGVTPSPEDGAVVAPDDPVEPPSIDDLIPVSSKTSVAALEVADPDINETVVFELVFTLDDGDKITKDLTVTSTLEDAINAQFGLDNPVSKDLYLLYEGGGLIFKGMPDAETSIKKFSIEAKSISFTDAPAPAPVLDTDIVDYDPSNFITNVKPAAAVNSVAVAAAQDIEYEGANADSNISRDVVNNNNTVLECNAKDKGSIKLKVEFGSQFPLPLKNNSISLDDFFSCSTGKVKGASSFALDSVDEPSVYDTKGKGSSNKPGSGGNGGGGGGSGSVGKASVTGYQLYNAIIDQINKDANFNKDFELKNVSSSNSTPSLIIKDSSSLEQKYEITVSVNPVSSASNFSIMKNTSSFGNTNPQKIIFSAPPAPEPKLQDKTSVSIVSSGVNLTNSDNNKIQLDLSKILANDNLCESNTKLDIPVKSNIKDLDAFIKAANDVLEAKDTKILDSKNNAMYKLSKYIKFSKKNNNKVVLELDKEQPDLFIKSPDLLFGFKPSNSLAADSYLAFNGQVLNSSSASDLNFSLLKKDSKKSSSYKNSIATDSSSTSVDIKSGDTVEVEFDVLKSSSNTWENTKYPFTADTDINSLKGLCDAIQNQVINVQTETNSGVNSIANTINLSYDNSNNNIVLNSSATLNKIPSIKIWSNNLGSSLRINHENSISINNDIVAGVELMQEEPAIPIPGYKKIITGQSELGVDLKAGDTVNINLSEVFPGLAGSDTIQVVLTSAVNSVNKLVDAINDHLTNNSITEYQFGSKKNKQLYLYKSDSYAGTPNTNGRGLFSLSDGSNGTITADDMTLSGGSGEVDLFSSNIIIKEPSDAKFSMELSNGSKKFSFLAGSQLVDGKLVVYDGLGKEERTGELKEFTVGLGSGGIISGGGGDGSGIGGGGGILPGIGAVSVDGEPSAFLGKDDTGAKPDFVAGTKDFGVRVLNPTAYQYQTIKINHQGSTMYNADFEVLNKTVDGGSVGSLVKIDVSDQGTVTAVYDNGDSKVFGKVAVAKFDDNQELIRTSDTSWMSSYDSGEPMFGVSGTNGFGSIQASALESSNADNTTEMINMISSQQLYQSAAKVITVSNEMTDSLLRI